jgi:dihydrodipicolinate synthase/N-acetylneuraminate lyase
VPIIRQEKNMKPDWKGIFFVAATQINEDETINYEATQRIVEGLLRAGAHGIIMLGRYGEVIAMQPDEKRKVLAAAKEVVGNRVPLLSGAIETNMDALVSYARDLETMGIDGLMPTTLLGYPPRAHEGKEFIRRLAAGTGLPLMIYNEPHGFGLDFTPALLNELRDIPQLVAIKESTDDTRRITEISQQCGDRYLTFCGQDDIAYESFMLGAVGWVCATGSPFPHETVALYELLQQRRHDEALKLYRWMYPILNLDRRSTFVQCGKLANQMFGQGTEHVRMPLRPLSGPERIEAIAVIEHALATRPPLPILQHEAA